MFLPHPVGICMERSRIQTSPRIRVEPDCVLHIESILNLHSISVSPVFLLFSWLSLTPVAPPKFYGFVGSSNCRVLARTVAFRKTRTSPSSMVSILTTLRCRPTT